MTKTSKNKQSPEKKHLPNERYDKKNPLVNYYRQQNWPDYNAYNYYPEQNRLNYDTYTQKKWLNYYTYNCRHNKTNSFVYNKKHPKNDNTKSLYLENTTINYYSLRNINKKHF